MKIISFLVFLVCVQYGFAQVGINTTTPNAQLDIRSSNQASPTNQDGILIPKVDAFPTTNPTAAQQGLLVYLSFSTTFSGKSKPYGFYYWDNDTLDWVSMGNNNPNSWNKEGNAGTDPTTDFIGTVDNADVVFRRFGEFSGLLSYSNTAFGFDTFHNPTNTGNVAFGSFSQSNLTTGSNNTAVGERSLVTNQTGSNNIAVGAGSLEQNRGSHNVAIGSLALATNSMGDRNVAIGSAALQNSIVSDNTAVGYQSQLNGTNAIENVSVGVNSLVNNNDGSGNTAVGSYALDAGYSENCTAVGRNALGSNITYDNTAVGSNAMVANSIGRFNTALGKNSLDINSSGDSNTAVGIHALNSNTIGSSNTAIGAEATTLQNNLTNATAIGANAMVGDSNSMVLGSVSGYNGSFINTKVGIGTIFPSERLHVVGSLRVEDGNQGEDKILVSDATGKGSWKDIANLSWGLKGNANTNPAINYIGTSDFTDVVFKRGNIHSGIISTTNTSFGFNNLMNGSNNSAFGAEAFSGNGQDNSAFGYQSLHSNSGGFSNSAFGASALYSNTFGTNNVGIGFGSIQNNTAGSYNTSLGSFSASNLTIGINNTTVGSSSLKGIVSGNNNSALGSETNFGAGNLTNSTAIGAFAQVDASNSMVLGGVNGINGATSNVNVGIGTTTPLDRLHVVGNLRMVDGNQASGKVLISDANGTATWTATNTFSSGTLDQAYDFGGAGLGRTITADTGAVTINGTDGLVSTGTTGSGAVAPSGAGTRMVWNPRKAAFRAGSTTGTQWDDANIGTNSVAFGNGTTASGASSMAFGNGATAAGQFAFAAGFFCSASGPRAVAFGNSSSASGFSSTAFGDSTIASGLDSTSFGSSTFANAVYSTAFGFTTTAEGSSSTAFGVLNTAQSFGETTLGIGATNYIPTTSGTSQFRAANAADRLFVIGNAIDANNNNTVDAAERSDALVILKNGNTGIGSSTPQDKLHIVGNLRMVDGNQAAGKVLTSDGNGTATWQNASNNAWGLTGNAGTSATTNFIGTSDDVDVIFKRNAVRSGLFGTTNSAFGVNALNVASTGTNNTAIGVETLQINTTGSNNTAIGFNAMATINQGSNNTGIGAETGTTSTLTSNATAIGYKAIVGGSNCVVLGSVNGINGATSSVNVGIGTISPATALEVVDANAITSSTVEGTINVMTNGPQAIDAGGSITLGGTSTDAGTTFRTFGTIEGRKANSTTASNLGYLMFKTNNGVLGERMRITSSGDVGIGTAAPGGQFELSLNEGRKPTSNTWIIPSDARLKNVNGIYEKGLEEILQLKPIRYHYKNTDKRTFDPKVLDKEAYGFLAQEVQPLFPEAVGTDPDGYLNFDLHPILIASVNAFKELDSKNKELQAENQLLKAELEKLKDKVDLILNEMQKR